MRRAGFGTTSLVTVRLISMTNSRELSPEFISFDSLLQTYRQSRLFILAGLRTFATERSDLPLPDVSELERDRVSGHVRPRSQQLRDYYTCYPTIPLFSSASRSHKLLETTSMSATKAIILAGGGTKGELAIVDVGDCRRSRRLIM
jgi:hypothetical protein